jgi:hypothetical protein
MKKIVLGVIKNSTPKMSKEEVRKYYETIKGSARVSEVKTTYKRSRDKRVSDYE